MSRWSRVGLVGLIALTHVLGHLSSADAQTVRSASGANAAAIDAAVLQFRIDLGGGNNGTGGTFATGWRNVHWDDVPDAQAAPANFAGNFFNVTLPRGLVMSTPGTGLQVSMDDNVPADADPDQVRFANLNAAYAAQFQTFSPQRLFTSLGSTVTDVSFVVPGTSTRATVRGFGVVFTDVDIANRTKIEIFHSNGTPIATFFAPVGAMSFVGVSYPSSFTIGHVRITSGTIAVGAAETALNDVVVMDDFIYGEPQALPPQPHAYGTTAGNNLVRFDLASPGAYESNRPIIGMQPGEVVLGLDHRPADAVLYALGSTGRLYRLTPGVTNVAAEQVGSGTFSPALTGTRFGFDFNAMVDRIRVVGNTGANFRLVPETGAVVGGAFDTSIAYAPGDVNAGVTPQLVAVAYTNSFPGADATVLYGLDAQTDSLVLINNPNSGQLSTIGPVGLNFTDASFDIQQGTNFGFATLQSAASIPGSPPIAYAISLGTGAGTSLGAVGSQTLTAFTLMPNGVFQFTTLVPSATEGGVAQAYVQRVGGSFGSITGTAAAIAGTAGPADYNPSFLQLTFTDGQVGPASIPVITSEDSQTEGTETFTLALVSPFTGLPNTTTVTIVDNEVPAVSIGNATVLEGDTGKTVMNFTIICQLHSFHVTVFYETASDTAIANGDFLPTAGSVTFAPGEGSKTITVEVIGDIFREGTSEQFFVNLRDPSGATINDGQGVGTITDDDNMPTYYFAEGATGGFFDYDIAIGNPNPEEALVVFKFLLPDGEPPISISRALAAQSRTTMHVDGFANLANRTGVSTVVTSLNGHALAVDRLMRWDASHYGGHSGRANTAPSTTWYFAEGVQNGDAPQTGGLPYFDTFLLLANTSTSATTATVRFLLEPSGIVTKTYDLLPNSRLTVYAGAIPEIVGRSFAMDVTAAAPILAERSTYFGSARLWDGGHGSTGVPAPSTSWFLAEGATGPFFETFLALANPNSAEAQVQVTYLPAFGSPIVRSKTIPGGARLTINIEGEDSTLSNAAVSTVVSSDQPIVAERIMYWPDPATSWAEAHSTFGVTESGVTWGLGEGRVGGPENFETYVLIANPGDAAAEVSATFYRNEGASAPIVKSFTIPSTSRFNLHVNSLVPELANEEFSTRIAVTNGRPVVVEGAIYWDAFGVHWAGGGAIVSTRLP